MLQEIQNLGINMPVFLWNLLLVLSAIILGLIIKFVVYFIIRRFYSDKDISFSLMRSILKRAGRPLEYFLPLAVFNTLLPLMKMPADTKLTVDHLMQILSTLAFAGLLVAIVKVTEDYVYHKYDVTKDDNLKERKIRTQLQFIRQFVIGVIVVVALCIILLSFDSLRKLGAGLLTGVGVGGIIVGFAAQKSLSNLLAGFQIAFTQPIRIDDVLVLEGEWGRVEEITLTYVVLKIWDERRLILPINYFIEKPFQNWTRSSAQILGTVFIYMDYTVPVDALRAELTRLLEAHMLWDKRVNVLQITNTDAKTIEVRALMSSSNSGNAFDLRCDVREGLIRFIQNNYPDSLPKSRSVVLDETGSNKAKKILPE
jgi:small-conductance mechanosensitive channel